MTTARHPQAEGDGAPVIVRIGGLSLDVVEGLSGGLGALLAEGAGVEARLATARAELVERVFAAVPGAPPELRTLLLAIKRDCHNARPLAPRVADARWEAVRALAGDAADRVPRLEAEAAAHEARFAAAHAAELARERCNLLAPLDDAAFARGLALASPDLADAVRGLRRTPPGEWGRRERKAEIGLLRYVTRAAAKVSPFSTLTPVGVGVLSGDPALRAIRLAERPWRARSLVRLRSYLVHRLVDLLRAYPPFRDGLRVEMNDSLAEVSPERFLLLRPQHYHADLDAGRIRHQRDALVTTELRGPVVTRAAELLAGGRTPYGALVATLQAELGDGARAQLERLATLGVLQLLLPWPAHEPWPEKRLLEHLRTLPAEPALDALVDGLARLVALEEGYASAAEPVRSIRALEALIGELTRSAAALAGLGPDAGGGEPATPYNLGEDVYLRPEAGPALAEVPLESARQALDQARLLVRLGVLFEDRFEFRHALAAFARERWPGRGEVGVVEALHQAGPLWQDYAKFHFAVRRAPAGAPVTWNPMELPEVEALHRWRTQVHAGLEGCLRQEDGEQRLCPDALRALLAPVPAELTDAESWGAMLMLQPASADGALWVLNAVKEGTGRYGSRYSPLMDDDTREWYASHLSTRGAFELEGERAELLDVLCVQGSTLNVHHPQTPSLLTTPGDETDLPAHRRVRLRDLRLAFDGPGGLPRLRGRGGERFLAVNLGFAYEAHMPTLLRFLCAFGPSELWGVMPRRARQRQGEVVMSGRTLMGNLVVHRRRWTVPAARLRAALDVPGDAPAFAAVARLRAEWGIPGRVYFNDRLPSRFGMTMEKPQYLDFTSPLFIPLLRAALKERETLTLTEPLPTPEMCPADRDGRRWAVELVLDSLALRAPQSPALAAVPRARRGSLVAAGG